MREACVRACVRACVGRGVVLDATRAFTPTLLPHKNSPQPQLSLYVGSSFGAPIHATQSGLLGNSGTDSGEGVGPHGVKNIRECLFGLVCGRYGGAHVLVFFIY